MIAAASRSAALALLFAALLLPAPARAAGFPAYDAAAFRAAQETGRPILVWVHAAW
ncbi:MAG: hypothetical protein AABZ64_00090 [Nitrospinota bacterium]